MTGDKSLTRFALSETTENTRRQPNLHRETASDRGNRQAHRRKAAHMGPSDRKERLPDVNKRGKRNSPRGATAPGALNSERAPRDELRSPAWFVVKALSHSAIPCVPCS
ncbi:hypothetical protein MTO96_004375 [Rhipicephalus appendiculatus]